MNYSSTNSIRKVVVSRPPMIRYLQILMFVNWTAVLVNSRKNTTGPGRPKNAYEGQLQLYPQNSLVAPIVISDLPAWTVWRCPILSEMSGPLCIVVCFH